MGKILHQLLVDQMNDLFTTKEEGIQYTKQLLM